MRTDPDILTGLPPILDAGVETLILGSFPSPTSLAAQQYYAHRQNQFWRLLGTLLGEPLVNDDYEEKKRRLLARHIGLWDVYHQCRREGALDSAIQTAEANDFSRLAKDTPRLRRVCYNGKTSARFERWFAGQGYATRVVPSTSPAYTMALARKIDLWRTALLGA
ncbi:MAG: DNA-deoxyinosine glycosylase [Propionivibrio sp.]